MGRYIRQRDNYSCGAVAVLNAAKWAGLSAHYKDLKLFRLMCHTTPGHGTGDQNLENCLRKLLQGVVTVQRGGQMDAKGAVGFLRNPNHAFVLMYRWHRGIMDPDTDGHFIFAYGDGTGYIYLVNHRQGPPTVTRMGIRKFWRVWMKKGDKYPRVWLLRAIGK